MASATAPRRFGKRLIREPRGTDEKKGRPARPPFSAFRVLARDVVRRTAARRTATYSTRRSVFSVCPVSGPGTMPSAHLVKRTYTFHCPCGPSPFLVGLPFL